MSRLEKRKKENKKKKIIIFIAIILVVVALLAVLLINQTTEEDITVIDVSDENIKVSYNKTLTTDNVIVTVKEYSSKYDLYYYIQEIGDVEIFDEEEPFGPTTKIDFIKNLDFIEVSDEEYSLYEDSLAIEDNSVIYFKYEKKDNYSINPYRIEITNIIKSEETEGATDEELEEEQVDPNDEKNKTSRYYIKVNYTANTVTIYQKDSAGNYTVPVKAMVCSTGTSTPTSGVYKTSNKYRWRKLVGDVYGQYATRIVGSILFHSVPYYRPSSDSLEYTEYDKLGTTASAGCVRLTVADAKWIYDNCPSGTMVEFYSSTNPGPLGKPSAQKISENLECRNYDPTDPVANNPWIVGTTISETDEEEIILEDEDDLDDVISNTETENNITEDVDTNVPDNIETDEDEEKQDDTEVNENDNVDEAEDIAPPDLDDTTYKA